MLISFKGGAGRAPSPDGALRHAWHRQGNVQRDLALASEDAHHPQGLHLAAGGVDRGTAQVGQLAEHHAVLVWDGAAGTAVRGRLVSCRSGQTKSDRLTAPTRPPWTPAHLGTTVR